MIRPGPEPTIEKVRNTCHASIIMFSDRLADPAAVVGRLDSLAASNYGTFRVTAFDIVSYARTFERVDTIKHAHVPLAARGSNSAP